MKYKDRYKKIWYELCLIYYIYQNTSNMSNTREGSIVWLPTDSKLYWFKQIIVTVQPSTIGSTHPILSVVKGLDMTANLYDYKIIRSWLRIG